MKININIGCKSLDAISPRTKQAKQQVKGREMGSFKNSTNKSDVKHVPLSVEKDADKFNQVQEVFFDSRAWLDSDCDDDFFSVNGDFSPSVGNTPLYEISIPKLPEINRNIFTHRFPITPSELSPSPRRKLADLLLETKEENDSIDGYTQKSSIGELEAKTSLNTEGKIIKPTSSSNLSNNDESVPNKELKEENEIGGAAVQCCIPGLVQSLSFKKRTVSRHHSSA